MAKRKKVNVDGPEARKLRGDARRLREEARRKLEKAKIIESEGYESFMFYLSASLKKRLRAHADESGMTMAEVIVAALEKYLPKKSGKA